MIKLAQPPSTTLFITVFVSVLVHGALLSFFLSTDQTFNVSTQPPGNVSFEISLVDHRLDDSTPPAKQPGHTITKNRIASPTQSTRPLSPVDATADQQTVETTTATKQVAQTSQPAVSTTSNDMMKYLETEFRTRFRYPAMARQRGWEGKVVVGLDVNRAGYIHNVNVKHSSGYSVLDNNAKRTFEQIGNVLPVLSRGNTQTYQFTIPVIYMLTKG